MSLSEQLRRQISTRAIWPLDVVLDAPVFEQGFGLAQRREPMLGQTFIARFSVEALDVGVFRHYG